MLLAELPVRGETLVNTGMRVVRRVEGIDFTRVEGINFTKRVHPHQWQGNGRAADVL